MKIGSLQIQPATVLAPMAGVTDLPFRLLCKEQGVGLLVSEMVSAKGLIYNNQKTFDLLKKEQQEMPLAMQLFGANPLELAKAARITQNLGADIIDINMGCPMPKIVNNGEGSALLKDEQLVYEILARVKEAITIPLTVKIRSGWDDNSINAPRIAQIAQKAGVDAISVHARTRAQLYQGKANWDIIKQVVQSVSIPVIGNGDITCAADALRMREQTGCVGIMIGRAAQGNPWLFAQVAAALAGEAIPTVSLQERFGTMHRHVELLIKCKGEVIALKEMRRHALSYVRGLPFAAEYREKFNKACHRQDITAIADEYLQRLQNYPFTI